MVYLTKTIDNSSLVESYLNRESQSIIELILFFVFALFVQLFLKVKIKKGLIIIKLKSKTYNYILWEKMPPKNKK